MPKALTADWNLAQVLYAQGVNYKAIAEKVSVTEAALRQRAHRYRWRTLKTAALETVSRAVTNHNGKTLTQRSNEVRSALAEEVGESVDALRQTPIKPKLAHLNERAEVSGKLAASANRLFGWNGEQGNCLVLVGMVSQLDPDNAPLVVAVATDSQAP